MANESEQQTSGPLCNPCWLNALKISTKVSFAIALTILLIYLLAAGSTQLLNHEIDNDDKSRMEHLPMAMGLFVLNLILLLSSPGIAVLFYMGLNWLESKLPDYCSDEPQAPSSLVCSV